MKAMSINIRSVADLADLNTVRDLAEVIWHQHYPGIITHKQIRYMLDRSYAIDVLKNDIQAGTMIELAYNQQQPVGVAAYGPVGKGCETKLHKLYLLQSFHGHGIGSTLLGHVEQQCRTHECQTIHLNVNKHNPKAIRSYERNGYRVLKSEFVSIGEGFFVDDFVMGKSLID